MKVVLCSGGMGMRRREYSDQVPEPLFDVMNPGVELVLEPFARSTDQRKLIAVPYDGFWQSMNTFEDKSELDDIAASGRPPWQVWSD